MPTRSKASPDAPPELPTVIVAPSVPPSKVLRSEEVMRSSTATAARPRTSLLTRAQDPWPRDCEAGPTERLVLRLGVHLGADGRPAAPPGAGTVGTHLPGQAPALRSIQ